MVRIITPKKTDVAVIVPQLEEYEAVKRVFFVSSTAAPASLPQGGSYVISEITTTSSSQPIRFAIACMGDMYNYPCLALTERLLQHIEPQLIFLVGSACGNLRKVNICDVVVTTESVAYLGRGRRQDETVSSRPYTEPIAQRMKDAITAHMMYRAEKFARWNRTCSALLKRICGTSLPPNVGNKPVFEVKSGIIASDDLVLQWSSETEARRFWAEHVREDAKAYDMESAGFSHACARRINQPNWAVIRGISDHGIHEQKKYHLAAATIAAEWLRGFITENTGGLLSLAPQGQISTAQIDIEEADLQGLYSLLEQEEKKNLFVGKRRFIRETLRSDDGAIRALEYAISRDGIKEYEVKTGAQTGWHSTTAIRLDKGSGIW